MLCSCKTTYVPVQSVHTEYIDRVQRDSIYVRDSVYLRERGDTVFLEKWHTKYIERLRVDSFCKIDSVQVPYPVEVIKRVEKKLSWWQQTKMDIGGVALGALLLVIGYFGVKLFKSVSTGGLAALIKGVLEKWLK
jgi:hypothetical protein